MDKNLELIKEYYLNEFYEDFQNEYTEEEYEKKVIEDIQDNLEHIGLGVCYIYADELKHSGSDIINNLIEKYPEKCDKILASLEGEYEVVYNHLTGLVNGAIPLEDYIQYGCFHTLTYPGVIETMSFHPLMLADIHLDNEIAKDICNEYDYKLYLDRVKRLKQLN